MEDDDEADMNAKGGALVEEAKKLMAQGNDDGEEQQEEPEAKGPKIKMRTRLGKNKKKPAGGKTEDAGRDTDAGPARSANIELKPSGGGASMG